MADLSQIFPWVLLLQMTRAVFTVIVISAIVQPKKNKGAVYCGFVAILCLYSVAAIFIYNEFSSKKIIDECLMMVGYYIIVNIYVYIFMDGRLFKKLFSALFSFAAYTFSSYVITVVSGILLKRSAFSIGTSTVVPKPYLFTFIGFVLVSAPAYYVILKLITVKNSISDYKIKDCILLMFILTIVITQALLGSIFKIIPNDIYENVFGDNGVIYNIGTILMNVLGFLSVISYLYVIEKNKKVEDKNTENEKLIMKNELDYEQMKIFKIEKQEFRKLKHDYLNVITTAKGFIEIGNYEKAAQILSKASTDISGIAQFSACSNDTINTILYIKKEQAKNVGARLEYEIDESYPMQTDDYDFCRLFSNCMC